MVLSVTCLFFTLQSSWGVPVSLVIGPKVGIGYVTEKSATVSTKLVFLMFAGGTLLPRHDHVINLSLLSLAPSRLVSSRLLRTALIHLLQVSLTFEVV